ncbi:hypothetical protein SAMN04489760_1191 [Syntrophus gentianae]|uniref:Uncharacterized protein n=1 Tax=Syntrophus gentianae TaxID=43775 RepID=A0A1H7YXU9_9BACT|nr:hypothetical protein SAMN04489760_1191 [Syntrophus gentianae]
MNAGISKLLGNGFECCVNFPKSIDELWIELRTASCQNDFYSLFMRKAFFIGTVRYESIIDIGDRHDSSR